MEGVDVAVPRVRRAVGLVLALNLLYFVVELTFALRANSVALVADSVDFFEDSALNFIILLSLGASLTVRGRVSKILALMMLIPAAGGVWIIVSKVLTPEPPDASIMTIVGIGALVVNVTCALVVARYAKSGSGLLLAAFFSARNDAIANLGIIIAGIVTMFVASVIPDIVVGVAIFVINSDSAYKIWTAATPERGSLAA